MLNNRGLKDIFIYAMSEVGIPDNQAIALMSSFSSTCKEFYGLFQGTLTERAVVAFYQAVIDDDAKKVKMILDSRPELLFHPLPQNFMIESKLTWQRFYVEDALTMSVKRKQITMIELLIPYYKALKQDDLIKQTLSAWVFYVTIKNTENKDEIIIPYEYALYAKSLIDVFVEEILPYGQLSKKTELALFSLFNLLLPKKAVKLDNYLDTELFLLAVYQAYRDYFTAFRNWGQRDKFCVRVIGLIQSTLHPETGKLFCESLDAVVKMIRAGKEVIISSRAALHQLKGGEYFYRLSRETNSGFFCACDAYALGKYAASVGLREHDVWENYVKQKQQVFEKLHNINACMGIRKP